MLEYFTNKNECDTFDEAKQLLGELAEFSDKMRRSTHDIVEYPQVAQSNSIQLLPGLVVIVRNQDKTNEYGIRFMSIPLGYEFSSLLQSIELVPKRDSGLKPDTRKELQSIRVLVQLKVFVTPT